MVHPAESALPHPCTQHRDDRRAGAGRGDACKLARHRRTGGLPTADQRGQPAVRRVLRHDVRHSAVCRRASSLDARRTARARGHSGLAQRPYGDGVGVVLQCLSHRGCTQQIPLRTGGSKRGAGRQCGGRCDLLAGYHYRMATWPCQTSSALPVSVNLFTRTSFVRSRAVRGFIVASA
jgi:hypothetical protein